MIKNISTKVLLASLFFFAIFLAVNLAFTRKRLNALVCAKNQANNLAGWKGILFDNGVLGAPVPVVSESFALFGQINLFANLHFSPGNEKSDPFIVSTLSLQASDVLPGVDIRVSGCKIKWVGFQALKKLKYPDAKIIVAAKPLNTEKNNIETKLSPPKMDSKPSANAKESSHLEDDFTEIEWWSGRTLKVKLKSLKYEKLPTHDERWEFEKGTIITQESKDEPMEFSLVAIRKSDNKRFNVCGNIRERCHYVGWSVEKKAFIFEDNARNYNDIGYVINGIKKHLCVLTYSSDILSEKGWLVHVKNPPETMGEDKPIDVEDSMTKISIIDIFSLRKIKIFELLNSITTEWKSDGTLQYWDGVYKEGKEIKEIKITKNMLANGELFSDVCGLDRSGPLKEVDLTKPRRKK